MGKFDPIAGSRLLYLHNPDYHRTHDISDFKLRLTLPNTNTIVWNFLVFRLENDFENVVLFRLRNKLFSIVDYEEMFKGLHKSVFEKKWKSS